MISCEDAQATLELALQSGADFGELFLEDSESRNMQLGGGGVENASYCRMRGAGLYLLRGERSVYVHSSDISRSGLLSLARLASAAMPGNGRLRYAVPPDAGARPVPERIALSGRVSALKQADAAAKSVSAEVAQVTCVLSEGDQRVYIYNSLGEFAQDRRVRTRFHIQVVASNGEEAQTGSEAPGFTLPFDSAKQRMDIEQTSRVAAMSAVTMLHAPLCPACSAPVVIEGGFGGVIFHEACGHALEATAVGKGNSVFCGLLGQPIAAACVSAVDDATLSGEWGTMHIDDEGLFARRNVLIENGVLKAYLTDRLGARRLGTESTASARRQGYQFAPTSRMTNTFIAPGKDDDDAMIASLGEGLWAKSMGGGSVNPLTGEFNFAVREGYWIKDGRVLHPVRGATLIGRGTDVLMRIERVGTCMTLGAGMCGSSSGSVPASVGQPRIRVSEMTIGGKG